MRGPNSECLLTMREVAKRLGISPSAVNQTERRALRKLRHGLLSDPQIREELEANGFAVAASAEGD